MALANQVATLSKSNYQLQARISAAFQNPENEVVQKELRRELEEEKEVGRALYEENQVMRDELVEMERELNEKSKKVKWLTLNLSRKELNSPVSLSRAH